MLVIELPALSHTKVRCEACVGEAPPDLPLRVEQQPIMATSTWSRIGSLPFDFKLAQSGRDPGEAD